MAPGSLCAQTADGLPAGRLHPGFAELRVPGSSAAGGFTAGVWYPARAGGERLTYRRYVMLGGGTQELEGLTGLLRSHGATAGAVSGWLDAPMLASTDASAAPGRYPVILIAQGNGQTLHDQAPLAELLSSHGYVVATAPSPMRLTGPMRDESEVGARAAEQASDLARVAAALAARSDVDLRRIGVVGHSFGARAGLLLAMRDRRVAAIVSWDGGIGIAAGRASLEAAPGYRAAAERAPVLHLYETLDSMMAPDFGLLASLSESERWLVEVPAMRHHLFTSLGDAALRHPDLQSALGADPAAARGYAAAAAATLEFLNGFLNEGGEASARLRSGRGWPGLGESRMLPRGATE